MQSKDTRPTRLGIIEYLSRQSRPRLIFGGLVFVLLLGLIDYFTPPQLSYTAFYLIPVALVSWFGGRRAGAVLAVASALVQLVLDLASNSALTPVWIPYANTVLRWGIFSMLVFLLPALRTLNEHLDQKTQERTAELTQEIAEHRQAEATVQQQNQMLSALHQIMLDVLQYHQPDQLLAAIIAHATEFLDAPYGEIMLREGDELVVRAYTPNQSFLAGDRVRAGEARLSWQAVQTREPAVLDDYATWPQRRDIYAPVPLHAVADFPIMNDERCLGVLDVGRDRPGYVFDSNQIQAGQLFAQLAALAIQNTQAEETLKRDEEKYRDLFNEAQQQSRELLLLNIVRTALAREVELTDLFHVVVEAIAKTLRYPQVSLYLLHTDRLQLQHQVGYEHIIPEIPIWQGVMARSARTGTLIYLPDVHSDPDFIGAIPNVTSEICVPLFDQGQAVGALNIESVDGRVLTEADVRTISAISLQINIGITRARLYSELREGERRYKELIDNAQEIIFETDARGIFTFVNPAVTHLTGYTAAELIGTHYLNLILPGHRRAARRFYFMQFRQKIPHTYFEFPVNAKDGAILWFGQNVQVILDPAGDHVIGAQAVTRDITDLHQAEAALRQHALELDARNAELDAFAHTVAHDLKNPISAILGLSELLLDDDQRLTPGQGRDAQRSIFNSARKLNNIIEELMLLAGLRQQQITPAPLEMASIIQEALLRLTFSIREAQAEFSLPDHYDWPTALGYAPWIEEVWANYLSNAIKYGGRPPRIEIGAAAQANGRARFWVRDNGSGLSPEDQSRLFISFTRLEQTRAEGHGLGLSIVKRIIDKLGGEVGVESEVGRGSTFYFTLPIAPGT